MTLIQSIESKIFHDAHSCQLYLSQLYRRKVWTNGCFDLIHRGHLINLMSAKAMGEILIVGLNSDISVRSLKGENRPIQDQDTRALILASLSYVDVVLIFDNSNPLDELALIRPDIYVKGSEYDMSQLPEAQLVCQLGGVAKSIPMIDNISSSLIISKILDKKE